MNTSPSTVAQRKSIGLTAVSALSTFALVGGIVAGFAGPATSAPARAALPTAAFTASACEGTDTADINTATAPRWSIATPTPDQQSSLGFSR